jgi:hypothetical protein
MLASTISASRGQRAGQTVGGGQDLVVEPARDAEKIRESEDALRPLVMRREIVPHEEAQREQGHAVVDDRPEHRRLDKQEADGEQQHQDRAGGAGLGERALRRRGASMHHRDDQSHEEQDGHDVQQPRADLRQSGEGRRDPGMGRGHLAQVHAEPRHETVQHELQEGGEQDQLDRVFEQGAELPDLSAQPLADGRRLDHEHPLLRRAHYICRQKTRSMLRGWIAGHVPIG